ncbi:MAG TPA: formate dehydrogenase accessory sulfurtransferase FdhD [Acidimicrobiia bacterium]|nr:formate dehydrogenase accessory sulfurtransferase FdhD [Acidimicrobiia bacterium]
MSGIIERHVDRLAGATWRRVDDRIVEEVPLEIRLEGTPLAVVMRTPGHDADLILGFALTEGILLGPDELGSLEEAGENRWNMRLAEGVSVDPARFQRNFYSTSSCGVCGKASIDAIRIAAGPLNSDLRLSTEVLAGLPDAMRAGQVNFEETGGIHAAAAVTVTGELIDLREDVGRHNAVDKLVGALAPDRWRFDDLILFVSGRMSFEVVQKAAVAGFPLLCGISAASSLAVELGEELGMTLVGFVRDGGCTVYCGRQRIE